MISISKPDIDNVKKFNLKDNFVIENSMVIYDGNSVAGITYYSILNEYEALLDEVFIEPQYRNQYFGDSIVKAILNVADKRGVKRVFINTSHEDKVFFDKVGFLNPNELEIDFEYKYSEDTMVALLPDFFNTACRSKK